MYKIKELLIVLDSNETSEVGLPELKMEAPTEELITSWLGIEFPAQAFDSDTYKSLLPLMRLATVKEQGAEDLLSAQMNSAKLTITFGNKSAAIRYLLKFEREHSDSVQPIHDACLFSPPAGKKWNVKVWRSIATKYMLGRYMTEIKRVFAFAEKIETYVALHKAELTEKIRREKDEQYKNVSTAVDVKKKENDISAAVKDLFSTETSLNQLLEYVKRITFARAAENPTAAQLFLDYGVSETLFERYLELKPCDDSSLIPSVGTLRLASHPDFYLKKLSPSDPRAAILGELTSCCQSLGKQGEQCAIYGITDPNSGFYVLCKQNSRSGPSVEDPIMAQAWAWRGRAGCMVLDSIEIQYNFAAKYSEYVCELFQLLADTLVRDNNIPRVLVGVGGATPRKICTNARSLSPDRYKGSGIYSDAREQVILSDVVTLNLRAHANFLQYLSEWAAICAQLGRVLSADTRKHLIDISPPEVNISILIAINEEYLACTWNDLAQVPELIRKGANVSTPIPGLDQLPILKAAMKRGEVELVKICLERSNYFQLSRAERLEYLNACLDNPRVEVAEFLLSIDSDLCLQLAPLAEKDPYISMSAYHYYFVCRSTSMSLINVAKESPLHAAAVKGRLDLVRLYLSKGARVNALFKNLTILLIAIYEKSFEMTKYLLECGALSEATIDVSDTKSLISEIAVAFPALIPLLIATIRCRKDVNFSEVVGELLHIVVRANDRAMTLTLIEDFEAPVDIQNSHGSTPLHYAVVASHYDMARLLLSLGANVNIVVGKRGEKFHLLEHCVNSMKFEFLRELVELWGAKVNYGDIYELDVNFHPDYSLLFSACTQGYVDVAKYLVEQGAHVEDRSADGSTPLLGAFEFLRSKDHDLKRIVYFLVEEAHANVNAITISGRTVMHMLSCKKTLNSAKDFFQLFIHHGAKINLRDSIGNTPLHVAVNSENLVMVELLIRHNAKLDLPNKENKTARMLIVESGIQTMIDCLRMQKHIVALQMCGIYGIPKRARDKSPKPALLNPEQITRAII